MSATDRLPPGAAGSLFSRSRRLCGPIAVLFAAAGVVLSGCTLMPAGSREEQARLDEHAARYEPPFEKRELPALPERPAWRDVLLRAFWANGELEAAYFQWKAAMQRVRIAGAYPNSNVSVGFGYMFSPGDMKAFDRATFSAGFDPSMNLSLPVKVRQKARVALDEARVAGDRLRALKFDLQRKVLFAWADYTRRDRTIAAMRAEEELLRLLEATTAAGAQAGGAQERLLNTRIELERTDSRIRDMEADQEMARAEINAMLGRDPAAPLAPDSSMSARRRTAVQDSALIAAAAETFPEVAMSVSELAARKDALELARLQWLPDVNPTFSFTGTISQTIGAMVMLPTMAPAIKAGIRAAEADVRAGEALVRQKKADRMSEYVGLLVSLRRSQERSAWIEQSLRPAIVGMADLRMRAYESGSGDLAMVLEARRMLVEADVAAAESWAQAEKALVDIECCLGVDIETLERPKAPASPEASMLPAASGPPAAPSLPDESVSPAQARAREHTHE